MEKIRYIIYRTTCLATSKYYIGKHVTSNINDGYLGSGLLLQLAFRKYGKEQFVREILEECSNHAELARRERELVNDSIINDPMSFNLAYGGQGGNLGPIVNERIGQAARRALKGKKKSIAHRRALSAAKKGMTVSEEQKQKTRNTMRARYSQMSPGDRKAVYGHPAELNGFYGKSHSEETKQRMRESVKLRLAGIANPSNKPITVNGVTYDSRKQCMEALGLTKYTFYKLQKENKLC